MKVEGLFIQAWDIQKAFTTILGIDNIFWGRSGGLQPVEQLPNSRNSCALPKDVEQVIVLDDEFPTGWGRPRISLIEFVVNDEQA